MLKVGLTGGIGSGKSAVSDIFQSFGIPVIDTDVIARELVEKDDDVLSEIVKSFGQQILDDQGKLDRKKLARTVFSTEQNKHKLESILHPKIRLQVNHLIQSQENTSPYCIIVVPLLLETDFHDLVDHILVVIADEQARIERVKRRDDRDVDEIRAIIKNQVDDEKRLNKADSIIKNNGNIKELEQQVSRLHEKFLTTLQTID